VRVGNSVFLQKILLNGEYISPEKFSEKVETSRSYSKISKTRKSAITFFQVDFDPTSCSR
jgi:hypothetical protein